MSNEISTWRMWVLKSIWAYVTQNMVRAFPGIEARSLKCEINPLPLQLRAFKWNRQALNTEPIPEARVRGSLVSRLYHADWFVAVDLLIFHILIIHNKDATGSRQLSPRPGWYGFAHALGTGQAVGWVGVPVPIAVKFATTWVACVAAVKRGRGNLGSREPREWSRALTPYPCPFERLPRRLQRG